MGADGTGYYVPVQSRQARSDPVFRVFHVILAQAFLLGRLWQMDSSSRPSLRGERDDLSPRETPPPPPMRKPSASVESGNCWSRGQQLGSRCVEDCQGGKWDHPCACLSFPHHNASPFSPCIASSGHGQTMEEEEASTQPLVNTWARTPATSSAR